jgi:hypothetical protein
MYCESCQKQVIIYGVSMGAVSEDELSQLKTDLEKKGILVLFNPPPLKRYFCPVCRKALRDDNSQK